MINVNEAPIKDFFLDPEKTKLSPVGIMFLTQLARVAQGKDWSAVKAADSALLNGIAGSSLPGALVWDHAVTGSAVDSVTTNGVVTLAGLAHGGYRFEFLINNPAGAAVSYRLYVNNDTTGTDYYYWYYFYGVSAANVTPMNDAYIVYQMGASNRAFISGDIVVSPDGMIILTGTNLQVSNYTQIISWKKTAVVADLTRLDIVASAAGKINVNSRFRLWRKI